MAVGKHLVCFSHHPPSPFSLSSILFYTFLFLSLPFFSSIFSLNFPIFFFLFFFFLLLNFSLKSCAFPSFFFSAQFIAVFLFYLFLSICFNSPFSIHYRSVTNPKSISYSVFSFFFQSFRIFLVLLQVVSSTSFIKKKLNYEIASPSLLFLFLRGGGRGFH